MKVSHLVPFAALSAAIVVPTEQVFGELAIEDHHTSAKNWFNEANSAKDHFLSEVEDIFEESSKKVKSAWSHVSESAKSVVHSAYEQTSKSYKNVENEIKQTTDVFSEWIESSGSLASLGEHEGPVSISSSPSPLASRMILEYTGRCVRFVIRCNNDA
jgi:gas vesicle protein